MVGLVPWKRRENSAGSFLRPWKSSRSRLENHPLAQIQDEMNAMFERFFGEAWPSPFNIEFPSLMERSWIDWNLGWQDKGEEYLLQTELPGFEPEDLDVRLHGNAMTIVAERKEELNTKNGGTKTRRGAIRHSFTIPEGADVDRLEAKYHSGVLEIHLPKTEQAKGRRIPVKTN